MQSAGFILAPLYRVISILIVLGVLAQGSRGQSQPQSPRPDCTIAFSFSAAASSSSFDNRQNGCTNWVVTYTASGFSVLALTLQSAPDNAGVPGTWVTWAGTVASGVNPNTNVNQNWATFTGYYPWVRMTLNGLTGTGTVKGLAYGWRTAAARVGGGGGGGGSPTGPAGGALDGDYPNPILANLPTVGSIPFVDSPGVLTETPALTYTPEFSIFGVNGGVVLGNKSGESTQNVVASFGGTYEFISALFQLDGGLHYGPTFSSIGNNPYGAFNLYYKSRSVDGTSPVEVLTGDTIAELDFYGDTPTGFNYAGGYRLEVESPVVASEVFGMHVWNTQAVQNALTLRNSGDLVIGSAIDSGFRFDVTLSGHSGTARVKDQALGGNTVVVIGAGAGQTSPLLTLEDVGGSALSFFDAAGDLSLTTQSSITGVRFLCIGTTGKITSQSAACIGT